jgi:phosphoglycolate phosphatase-like HAD superfamily hydrolase/ADP-ribose pyrophosphatase YjhB (NUDIX family)
LPVTEYYGRVLPDAAPADLERWFHERFRQVQDRVTVLPHAREFLEYCRSHGCRVVVLTTVPELYWRAQAERLGLLQLVDDSRAGVIDKRDTLGEMLRAGTLQARETLMVGDMQHDIAAAKAHHVGSCAVLTGYNRLDQLREAGPDAIVEHLGELRDRLDRQRMELAMADGGPRAPIATVGALIRGAHGKWLMVRTRKWSDLWGIPGGKIKYGETSEQALRREIREETRLEIDQVRFVLVQDCVESREFYRPEHFLLLNYTCECVGSHQVQLDEEAQEHRWVSEEEALALPLNTPTRVLFEAMRSASPDRVPSRNQA